MRLAVIGFVELRVPLLWFGYIQRGCVASYGRFEFVHFCCIRPSAPRCVAANLIGNGGGAWGGYWLYENEVFHGTGLHRFHLDEGVVELFIGAV
jgi:hypothetical protein